MIINPIYHGISIVVPVYNSSSLLKDLILRLEKAFQDTSDFSKEQGFEVILVNDGSRDNSWEQICQISKEYRWVRGLNLMRNYGQHNALLCGLRAAQFEITVTIDDDLQHPPEEIHKLVDKLSDGYDVVYGTPIHQSHSLWRNFASYITRLTLQSTMGIENARKVSAFRAIRTKVREAFQHYQSPYVVLDVLLSWGTTRFVSLPTRHEPRAGGTSNYTLSKLILHAVNMLTGFTVLPLQMASLLGFGFALFGILVLLYVIGSLLDRRWKRSRISISCLYHRYLFRCPAFCAWNHRRISGANAFQDHGKTQLCGSRRDR